MIEIDAVEARRLRARAQLLGGSSLDPAAVVARAGALQAQDLASVLRAIALRSAPGTTREAVRAAFDSGMLVRGWPMRGTLFALTPEDLAGIVRITGPRMRAALLNRRSFLGVAEADFELARELAIAALDEGPQSRAELARRWHAAGLSDGPGLSYHFVSTLAIAGILALGPFERKDQLVVRLRPSVEEESAVLTRIVRKFFAARGPATVDDLAWWMKLPKSLLAPAVAATEGLEELVVDGRPMRYLDDGVASGADSRVVLVPGFDEWLLGYGDRELLGSAAALTTVSTTNGIFRPAILVDGRIVGTWAPGKSPQLVERLGVRDRTAIEKAVAAWPHG